MADGQEAPGKRGQTIRLEPRVEILGYFMLKLDYGKKWQSIRVRKRGCV